MSFSLAICKNDTPNRSWYVDVPDNGGHDPIAFDLTERHAKKLAEEINKLLAKTEAELCPPLCERCGRDDRSTVSCGFAMASDEPDAAQSFRLCLPCVQEVRKELSKHR